MKTDVKLSIEKKSDGKIKYSLEADDSWEVVRAVADIMLQNEDIAKIILMSVEVFADVRREENEN